MTNENYSGHIKNEEIPYYYDKVLQKTSLNVKDKYSAGEYFNLGQESMYISLVMFDKYKIQFYSAISLTYNYTQNVYKQFKYLDIASIYTIIRSCYETFLTFHYIYIQPELIGQHEIKEFNLSEESSFKSLQLKILLYKYEGYKQSVSGFSSLYDEQIKNKNISKEYEVEILNNEIMKSFSEQQQKDILNNWRPSWNKIALKTELSKWNSNNMYNQLSQHSHNAYTSLMLLDKHYTNLDKFSKESMLLQLYEFTAILVKEYAKLFNINSSIFSKEEISLLSEFYYLAHKNPGDTIETYD